MSRATTILRRPAVKPERIVDEVRLPHAGRSLRAGLFATEGGASVEVALDRDMALDDGDALKLEDGGLIVVRAAPETLLELRSESAGRLVRIAWHLGDQHVPMEAGDGVIHVPAGPAAAELARGLGAAIREVERPFRPERSQGHHHCDHDHDHGHHHHHGHDHGHAHGRHDHGHRSGEAGHGEAHRHGTHDHAGHGHGHDHAHGGHGHERG